MVDIDNPDILVLTKCSNCSLFAVPWRTPNWHLYGPLEALIGAPGQATGGVHLGASVSQRGGSCRVPPMVLKVRCFECLFDLLCSILGHVHRQGYIVHRGHVTQ